MDNLGTPTSPLANIPQLHGIDIMPLAQRNDAIDAFEIALSRLPNQIDATKLPLKHFRAANGLYAREIFIPQGLILTGAIKKAQYIAVMSLGHMTEVTAAGVQYLVAPKTMICLPGTKRIGFAHTDCIWVTFHRSEKESIEDIQEDIVATSYADAPDFVEEFLRLGGKV